MMSTNTDWVPGKGHQTSGNTQSAFYQFVLVHACLDALERLGSSSCRLAWVSSPHCPVPSRLTQLTHCCCLLLTSWPLSSTHWTCWCLIQLSSTTSTSAILLDDSNVHCPTQLPSRVSWSCFVSHDHLHLATARSYPGKSYTMNLLLSDG